MLSPDSNERNKLKEESGDEIEESEKRCSLNCKHLNWFSSFSLFFLSRFYFALTLAHPCSTSTTSFSCSSWSPCSSHSIHFSLSLSLYPANDLSLLFTQLDENGDGSIGINELWKHSATYKASKWNVKVKVKRAFLTVICLSVCLFLIVLLCSREAKCVLRCWCHSIYLMFYLLVLINECVYLFILC